MNINIDENKNIKFEARPDNLNRYLTIILWILLFSFYIFLFIFFFILMEYFQKVFIYH